MTEELETLRRKARPEDLESLRRLDRALQRSGWRVEGKTPREHELNVWIRAHCVSTRMLIQPPPTCATPVLLETLRVRSTRLPGGTGMADGRGHAGAERGAAAPRPAPGSRVSRPAAPEHPGAPERYEGLH